MAETWQQRSTRERAEASFGFGGSSLSRIKRQRLMRGDNGKRLAAIVSRSRAAIAAQSSGERSGCTGAVGEPGKGFPPLGLPAGSMAGRGGEKGGGCGAVGEFGQARSGEGGRAACPQKRWWSFANSRSVPPASVTAMASPATQRARMCHSTIQSGPNQGLSRTRGM